VVQPDPECGIGAAGPASPLAGIRVANMPGMWHLSLAAFLGMVIQTDHNNPFAPGSSIKQTVKYFLGQEDTVLF
jgi:hypothetical protein